MEERISMLSQNDIMAEKLDKSTSMQEIQRNISRLDSDTNINLSSQMTLNVACNIAEAYEQQDNENLAAVFINNMMKVNNIIDAENASVKLVELQEESLVSEGTDG